MGEYHQLLINYLGPRKYNVYSVPICTSKCQKYLLSVPQRLRQLATDLHNFTGSSDARWRGGATDFKAFWLAISRSRVQILLEATLRNNLRQVVYTYVPLSPSSITWYRPNGGDTLRLGR